MAKNKKSYANRRAVKAKRARQREKVAARRSALEQMQKGVCARESQTRDMKFKQEKVLKGSKTSKKNDISHKSETKTPSEKVTSEVGIKSSDTEPKNSSVEAEITGTKKPFIKVLKGIGLVSCVGLIIGGISLSDWHNTKSGTADTETGVVGAETISRSDALIADETASITSGVIGWCNSFVQKDFAYCDNLAAISNGGITGFNLSGVSNKASERVYDIMYEKLAESIKTIEVIDTQQSGNETVYTLTVTYVPYEEIANIDIDLSGYQTLCDDYLKGNINSEDLEQGLQDCIGDWFSSCFERTDLEYIFTIDMREVNGRPLNTVGFVNRLLKESRVKSIEAVFEEQIVPKIDSVLSEY